MSRIGRKPIAIPAGVEVSVDAANVVTVKQCFLQIRKITRTHGQRNSLQNLHLQMQRSR